MEITVTLIDAVERSVQALEDSADKMTIAPEYELQNSVGRIVRKEVENLYQTIDMLKGWIVRARKELANVH